MKASASVRSPSLLNLPSSCSASESGGSLDKTPSSRFRTKSGFAGPAGTFFSASNEVDGAAESAVESASSGVGRLGAWADDRGRTCLWEGGSSHGRDLLDPAIFGA